MRRAGGAAARVPPPAVFRHPPDGRRTASAPPHPVARAAAPRGGVQLQFATNGRGSRFRISLHSSHTARMPSLSIR
ncbi:hypothetical protein BURPS668_3026 [Burkholderia pseudomallei 668]|uniref:Uncharacterized protein n=1 Tax=Burkholderia pseudomallei 1710a TaxID=320371 RepID=A0A0E1W7Z0_BURPE|nr:hypothetical protein BURPS668_3026 [Burkholderia pseudomallei 668]EDO95155.1 hypothetical protein BURPSPAST_AB0326 [Burkholderia pseudomallei Pasteur 52237]EET08401.1 hypothetical protein BURPS1710A_3572 [Burkholderia pseudomallei 1710a]VUD53016.1 unnamed protein product [Burkholderia pseudomallei]